MNSIPPDIYARVHELTVAIVNASGAGDTALHDSLCLTLRAYYEDQSNLGRLHPFLTEAMADFTSDCAEAIRLYELALEQCTAFPEEPRYTKMISMAQRLIEFGRREQADSCLIEARAEAIRLGDTFSVQDADRLLQGLVP